MRVQDLSNESLADGLEHLMKIETNSPVITNLARSLLQEAINRLRTKTVEETEITDGGTDRSNKWDLL